MNKENELLIPRHLFEALRLCKSSEEESKVVEEILKNQMFQMLNDYPIPTEYCLHLRQIVYPHTTKSRDGEIPYKSYKCINCNKYL